MVQSQSVDCTQAAAYLLERVGVLITPHNKRREEHDKKTL